MYYKLKKKRRREREKEKESISIFQKVTNVNVISTITGLATFIMLILVFNQIMQANLQLELTKSGLYVEKVGKIVEYYKDNKNYYKDEYEKLTIEEEGLRTDIEILECCTNDDTSRLGTKNGSSRLSLSKKQLQKIEDDFNKKEKELDEKYSRDKEINKKNADLKRKKIEKNKAEKMIKLYEKAEIIASDYLRYLLVKYELDEEDYKYLNKITKCIHNIDIDFDDSDDYTDETMIKLEEYYGLSDINKEVKDMSRKKEINEK